MRIKSAVHGNELHAFLSQEIKLRALAQPAVLDVLSQAKPVSTAKAREWLRVSHEAADQVGRMPPEPPTLRARAGAVLVAVVRRMLFWFSPQITSANQALLSVLQEQTTLIEQLASQVEGLRAKLNEVAAEHYRGLDRMGSEFARIHEELPAYVRAGEEARENTRNALEREILQLRGMFLPIERRLTESEKSISRTASDVIPAGDSLYLQLENRFRGPREEVTARIEIYLPYLQAAGAGGQDRPVLDLGSGRCEWLELLRRKGLCASGVDMNEVFVTGGRESGLDVTFGDVIASLKQRPDESLGCVTGFHIMEHLPWSTVVELVDESLRVLKPGGIAIFETPNPNNLQVGSKNFYFDPTHRNPLPDLLLKFVLTERGFTGVEVLHLNACAESSQVPPDGLEVTQRFNEFFYGPQDYAVIGRK